MDERLKKQLDFALEIDKEKNIFRQTHLSGHEEMKMMQSMHGIWRSWHIFSETFKRIGGYCKGNAYVSDP